MVHRCVNLPDETEARMNIASVAYGMTVPEFIVAAIGAAITTCAERDKRLANVLTCVKA